MASNAASELPVLVEVTQDKLNVRLTVRADRAPKALDAPEIIAHLAKMGVTVGASGEAEIQELCRPRKTGRGLTPVVVASGTPCVDDLPPTLELAAALAQLPEAKRYVKAGDAVATLVAAKSGIDGIDVFGNPIVRKEAATEPSADASLRPNADGTAYHAAIDGIVRVRQGAAGAIVILPCLSQKGDVVGTVEQPRSVQSAGEFTIVGRVACAKLEAAGAIHVSGDLEHSTAICDGDLSAAAIRGATIDVSGNCVAAEVVQSRIACGGELIVENGNIAGGYVIAARGLTCKSLGSLPASGLGKTVIEIGIDHRFRQRVLAILPETDAQLAKAKKIRQTVEPLLKGEQSLTPRQQARVTELLAEADALEAEAQRRRREIRQEYDVVVPRCRTEITVADIVHPGVTIRFPGAQTTVRIAFRGGCRIGFQSNNNEPPRIILTRGSTTIPMELSMMEEDWRAAVKQLAA